jgi:hypothetical protein
LVISLAQFKRHSARRVSSRRRGGNVRFGSKADIEASPPDVRFTPKSGHYAAPAQRRLALQCREDAVRAGIGSEDLEAAVQGDLFGNMLQALNAAEFRQMYRDQIADQEGGA